MLKKKYIQRLLIAMTGVLLGFSSCDEPFKDGVFKASKETTALEWLEKSPDYSDWVKVLERVGRASSLNLNTQKGTFFVVNNSTLQAYAQSLDGGGVYNSIFELDDSRLLNIVQTHTIEKYAIQSINMTGRLGQKTSNGLYLTVAFDDTGRNQRYINNGPGAIRSYIVEGDNKVINGYVQVLDWPIITDHNNIWKELQANENYTIFCDLIRETKWFDYVLSKEDSILLVGQGASPYASAEEISANLASGKWKDYPYKDMKTVFVIPNKVFLDAGYEDAEGFRMEIFPDDLPSDPNSDFFEFIRYHIVNRALTYEDITDFPRNPTGSGYLKQKYLFSMAKKQSPIAVEDQDINGVFLNPQSSPVQINTKNMNILASNGYIHEIDGFMFVPELLPYFAQEVEFTDAIQFSAISFYREVLSAGATAQDFYFYSGNIPGITWSAASMQNAKVWYSNVFMPTKANPQLNRFKNFDGIFWNLGSEGAITFNMPPFGAGRYALWIENAYIPSIGGESKVSWGNEFQGTSSDLSHRDENKELIEKYSGYYNFLADRTPATLMFSVKKIGPAGVDRVIIFPRS